MNGCKQVETVGNGLNVGRVRWRVGSGSGEVMQLVMRGVEIGIRAIVP